MFQLSPERTLQPDDLLPFIGGQFAIFSPGSPRRSQGVIETAAIEGDVLHITFDWVVDGNSREHLVDATDANTRLRLPVDSFFVADKSDTAIIGGNLDAKGTFFKFMRPNDIDAI